MSALWVCLECGEDYKGLKNAVGNKCLNHKCKGNNKENKPTVSLSKTTTSTIPPPPPPPQPSTSVLKIECNFNIQYFLLVIFFNLI